MILYNCIIEAIFWKIINLNIQNYFHKIFLLWNSRYFSSVFQKTNGLLFLIYHLRNLGLIFLKLYFSFSDIIISHDMKFQIFEVLFLYLKIVFWTILWKLILSIVKYFYITILRLKNTSNIWNFISCKIIISEKEN